MLRSKLEVIKPHLVPFLILSGVTLALFWQALGHNFLVYWDDNGYVTKNTAIRGITWENIRTAFTSVYVGNYAPVQILSYMLDYSIWGMRPAGFIFANILIHAVNSVLFYYLLSRLSWQRSAAFAAAFIFLVHPVQVESVVWISQRKNVLSLLFFLVSFLWYLSYRDTPEKQRKIWYVASLIAFILALLAKSVAIILPLVLVSFDFCMAPPAARKNLKNLLVDKIPFFAVAFIFVFITIKSQSSTMGGGLASRVGGTPFDTLLTMLPVFVQYLKMVFWPADLSAVYAPAIKTGIDLEVALAALVLLLVAGLGIFLYQRRRDLLFWFVLFFLGLLPVSQIVPIVTLMNDRYLYFPMLGAAAFITSSLFLAIDKAGTAKTLVRAAAGAIFLLLVGHYLMVTYDRIPVWKDEQTLWEDAVRKVPNSPKARFSYAHILEYHGKLDESVKQYETGLSLNPVAFERYSLARLYEKKGLLDKAKEEYQRFLVQLPAFLDARNNLALIYLNEGKLDQAIEQYRTALQYDPAWARGYNNLAVAYSKRGNKDEALRNVEKAVSLSPGNAEFHYNLGIFLLEKGLKENALREIEVATRLDPGKPLYAIKFVEVSEMVKGKGRGKRN